MSGLPLRFCALALGAALVHGPAAAQTRAELRAGYTVGSHSGTAAGLDMAPALSYEALVVRPITPLLSVYGGYTRTTFGCEEGFCQDRDLTVTGSHAVLGAEARKAWAWLRLGLLVGKMEVGGEGESPDLGPGVHVGAGITLGSGLLSFRPGVSYRWMGASTPSSSDHAVAVAGELGVGILLGSVR